jgi:hypothetical protein
MTQFVQSKSGQLGGGPVGGTAVFGPYPGVRGTSVNGVASGLVATSTSSTGDGVVGTTDELKGAAVRGTNSGGGVGLVGTSGGGDGVAGTSTSGDGVSGTSSTGHGVFGQSNGSSVYQGQPLMYSGVFGLNLANGHGVTGVSEGGYGVLAVSYKSYGLWVQTGGSGPAAHIEGDFEVTGNIVVNGDVLLKNMDVAENFVTDGRQVLDPGTVVIVDGSGSLRPSEAAYDKRVVGVISGAGEFRPAVVLGSNPRRDEANTPVALAGRVACKVDAGYAAIEIGDLLTTSPTNGHAMRADDPAKAFGAVLGKALARIEAGQGLIPILVICH